MPAHPASPPAGRRAAGLCCRLALMVLAAVAAGCRPPAGTPAAGPEAPPAWFEDVTDRSGLDFVHDPGPVTDRYFLPQIMGSGAALFDYDNDGRLDVYLVQNGGPGGATNRLYHQRPDGTFEDASAGSGLDVAGYGMGVAVGDVNNDGRPDVLLTEYGRVRLFLNRGGGRFRARTARTAAGESSRLFAGLAGGADPRKPMKQNGTTAEFVANTPDGWAVDDPGAYQFLVSRDPPRPGSYLRLLKSDARSWRVLLYWATGIVGSAVGAAAACVGVRAGWLWLAVPGLAVGFAGLRLRWYVLVPVWIAVLAAVGAVGAADVAELAYPGLLTVFCGARLLAVML